MEKNEDKNTERLDEDTVTVTLGQWKFTFKRIDGHIINTSSVYPPGCGFKPTKLEAIAEQKAKSEFAKKAYQGALLR